MKSSSTESFYSTRSQPSSMSGSPPPETISHTNVPMGVPITSTVTTLNMGQLNHECQTLGLTARFVIDGDQPTGFSGYLQLGAHTITMVERWSSKKSAKESLAHKGLAVLKDLQIQRAEGESSVENWVGMLYDFYQRCGQIGGSAGPIFTEYAVGSLFGCTCLISLHPTPFGSELAVHTSKKAARTNAAREAMRFLISLGYATPDGKPAPKIKQSSALVAPEGRKGGMGDRASADAITAVLNNTDASFAQRVNELCPLLGLKIPQYRLESSGSSLYSGSACFPSEPLLRGPIGEVESIFGKKNAKEECARGVWKVLTTLATHRGLGEDVTDEEQDP